MIQKLLYPSYRFVPRFLNEQPGARLLFIFIFQLIFALNLNAQESIALGWPLTGPDRVMVPSGEAHTGFGTGRDVGRVTFDRDYGAMAGGWHSAELNPAAFYEYRLAPIEGSSLAFSQLKVDISLASGEMYTAVYYSTDGFRSGGTQIGQSLFFYTTSPQTLALATDMTVSYPDTLRIRIYAWGSQDPNAEFNNRNFRMEGTAYDLQQQMLPLAKKEPAPPETRDEMLEPMADVSFSAPDTISWTCPDDVTCIKVECWGAGGGGGGRGTPPSYSTARGGGGGAFASKVLTVIPSTTYTVVVGLGGAGGSGGNNPGSDGTPSLFYLDPATPLVRAAAGGGGSAGTSGPGGIGGSVLNSIGDLPNPYQGGNGVAGGGGGAGTTGPGGDANETTGTGGSGTAVDGGDGGTVPLTTPGSNPGNIYGGGGSGARKLTGAGSYDGGNGASGQVFITWTGLPVTNTPVVSSPICSGATSVSGTGEVDAAIVVYANATTQIGTATANSSGNWTAAVSPLPAGTIITATAKAIDKCLSMPSAEVMVQESPTAYITPDPASLCFGGSLNMDGNPGGGSTPYTNLWTGTGASYLSSTSIVNPLFSGAPAGSYTLIYTVTDNNGCIASDDITVTVHANPTANITPDPAAVCFGGSLNMNGNPGGGSAPYTHLWTGTGASYLSSTTIANPLFSSAPAGSYTLIYTVTDNNGCTGSDNITVTVHANPTASISPDPAAVCFGGSLNMNGNPGGGSAPYAHLWTGTGASYLSSTTIVNPLFSSAPAGSYTLIYTVTDNNGCKGSDNITVTVHANPTADISPDPAAVCFGGSLNMSGNPSGGSAPYTHLWTGTGASYLSSTTIINPVFSGAPEGSYGLTYTVTDFNGCTGTDIITVTVLSLPTITLGSNPAVCRGVTSANLTYSATTGSPDRYGIIWSAAALAQGFVNVPISTPLPGSPIVLVVPASAVPDTYTGTLKVKNSTTGCESTGYPISVTVYSNPSTSITPDPAWQCVDGSIQLHGNPSGGSGTYVTHLWTGDISYLSATDIPDPVFSGAPYGSYNLTYTVTDNNGCSGSGNINVNAVPFVDAGLDRSILTGQSTTLGTPAITGNTYFWTADPFDITLDEDAAQPIVSPLVTTIYTLVVTHTASGCTGTDDVMVTVTDNLVISKSITISPTDPGDPMQYKIIVTNNNPGGAPAVHVEITDYLPPDELFTFTNASITPTSYSGDVLTWDWTTVPALENFTGSLSITINGNCGSHGVAFWPLYDPPSYYIMTGGGNRTLSNDASISSDNTTTPIEIPAPVDKIVNQYCGPNLIPDDTVTGYIKSATPSMMYYVFEIRNDGNITDNFLLSVDPNLPPTEEDLTFSIQTTSGDPLVWTGWMQPGASFTFLVLVECQAGTVPDNWNLSNLMATSFVCGTADTSHMKTYIYGGSIPNACDLQIIKTVSSSPMIVGINYKYILTISNLKAPAKNVTIQDTLPPHVEFIEAQYEIIPPDEDKEVQFAYNPVTHVLTGIFLYPPKNELDIEIIKIYITVRPLCEAVPSVKNIAKVGSITADDNELNNIDILETPVISNIPTPQITAEPPLVCSGDVVTLTASGAPDPALFGYNWYDGSGNWLSSDNPYTPVITTTTQFKATIYELATPVCESDTAYITVTVFTATITAQPHPAFVCENSNTSFSILATGTNPLSYKWQVYDGSDWVDVINSVIYSGANSDTLSITGALLSMNGYSYRCLVQTGSCGFNLTSEEALLTVYPLPVCSIDGTAGPVCPASENNYTAPGGMSTYLWTVTGNAAIPGPYDQQNVTVAAGDDCDVPYILSLIITDANSCSSGCQITVNVNDDVVPVITYCPANQSVIVNNSEVYIHVDDTWDAIATDNCTLVSLTFSFSGATPTPAPPNTTLNGVTFNEGTTTVTWTAIDACGNETLCVFDVFVEGGADLQITKTAFPDPAIAGQQFLYNIVVSNLGPSSAPNAIITDDITAFDSPLYSESLLGPWLPWISPYIVPVSIPGGGSYTLYITGTLSLTQCSPVSNTASVTSLLYDPNPANNSITITTDVLDETPPTFTLPTIPDGFCVADIYQAEYSGEEFPYDLTYLRPDYYTFEPPDIMLNILNLNDNCTSPGNLIIYWQIDFGDDTSIDLDGYGQFSDYAGTIQFPLGTNRIYYTVSDLSIPPNSNTQSLIMVVLPRPEIIQGF